MSIPLGATLAVELPARQPSGRLGRETVRGRLIGCRALGTGRQAWTLALTDAPGEAAVVVVETGADGLTTLVVGERLSTAVALAGALAAGATVLAPISEQALILAAAVLALAGAAPQTEAPPCTA